MSLSLLLNLVSAQDPAQVDGVALPWTPDRLRSHPTVGLLLGNKDGNRVKRYDAGYEIREKFDGVVETDFAEAEMGSDYVWNSTGEMAFMRRPYRELRWSESIFKHEIAFQGGSYSAASHSRALWNILDKKELNFALGPIEKLENVMLWRTPDAQMEDEGTGALPIASIPSVINQWKTTMGVLADGLPPGFTSQQGLDPNDFEDPNDPTESTACVHQIEYAEGATGVVGSGNTSVGPGHLLEQMSEAMRFTHYESVPMVGRRETGEMVPAVRAILCSDGGYKYMEQTVRAHGGDLFRIVTPGAKEMLTFADFPLRPVPALRGKAIYPDQVGGTLITAVDRAMVTEDDPNGYSGPRYYFIDNSGVDMFFHAEGYWDIKNWYALDQINRDRIVKDGRLWCNLFFRNFRGHAIVAPSEDQDNFSL